jgi:hypothetical protein
MLGQHNLFSNGTETTAVQALVSEKVGVEQDLGASQPKFSMDGEQQQFIIHQKTALGNELASSPHHAFAISAANDIDNSSMETEGAYAGAQANDGEPTAKRVDTGNTPELTPAQGLSLTEKQGRQ